MKLLTVTNLYPGHDLPRHGIFVEERLRQLVRSESLSAEVIALRPNSDRKIWTETRHGIPVHYLSVPTLRLVTNWIDPVLWGYALKPVVSQLQEQSDDEIILDGHFLYPDGVTAAIVGGWLDIPVVLTARGSDVNVKCKNIVMRHWVRWACARSEAIITVSKALKDRLVQLGVEQDNIHVLRNGVDLEKFKPIEPSRKKPNADSGLSLLSVGHLIEDKGHHIAIKALTEIQGAALTIIGEGPNLNSLRKLAEKLAVSDRVTFLGFVRHEDMAGHYSAADATVLASNREGMPNVVLESLACGTRVIATDVGGIAEVICSVDAGFLLANRSVAALVDALRQLQIMPCERDVTRQYAVDNLGWHHVVERQRKLYAEVAGH